MNKQSSHKPASFLTGTAIAFLACSYSAHAKDLTIAGPSAVFEEIMRREVIGPYEKATGAKVNYVAGNSTGNLAKVIGQKNNQTIDLMIIDDGPMRQAVELGLCKPLPDNQLVKDVYPSLNIFNGKAVTVTVGATGIMYNKKWFEDNKIAPPTSWTDLADPKFKGKVVIPPFSNGFGLQAFLMINRINGGTENNVEPGFEAFTKNYVPNVLNFAPAPADMDQLFQTGQAVISANGKSRAMALAKTGFPVDFVAPKEGAVSGGSSACILVGAPNPEGAEKALLKILEPTTQVALAKDFFAGPSSTQTKLSPEIGATVPYGQEQISALTQLDWDVINIKRNEWTQRFNRAVQR